MMDVSEARAIALHIVQHLRPFCDRIEIAGSVRRGKPEVGDIEIVCIPKLVSVPLLIGSQTARHGEFMVEASRIGQLRKGNLAAGKYMQFWHASGVQVDLFTASLDNWGLIYAIRTGSALFSHEVLARGWVRAGYHSLDGMLCTKAHKVPIREEADLFDLIGIPWVPPKERT